MWFAQINQRKRTIRKNLSIFKKKVRRRQKLQSQEDTKHSIEFHKVNQDVPQRSFSKNQKNQLRDRSAKTQKN